MGEFGARQGRGNVEVHGAGAGEGERIGVEIAPVVHERGGAMDEELGGVWRGGLPAEADGGAAFAGAGEVGRLAPFQGFGERADAGGFLRGGADEIAQLQEIGARRRRDSVKGGVHVRRGESGLAHDGNPFGTDGERPSSFCNFLLRPAATSR